jgi:hypothetical protein
MRYTVHVEKGVLDGKYQEYVVLRYDGGEFCGALIPREFLAGGHQWWASPPIGCPREVRDQMKAAADRILTTPNLR